MPILISAGIKFRNRKFRYGVPVYTGPFRALTSNDNRSNSATR
jgi:hypothetical protein